jgi:hypothetical protein
LANERHGYSGFKRWECCAFRSHFGFCTREQRFSANGGAVLSTITENL